MTEFPLENRRLCNKAFGRHRCSTIRLPFVNQMKRHTGVTGKKRLLSLRLCDH